MKKPTFEEQFPGYELIPEKKRNLLWPVIWISSLVSLVALPLLMLYLLGIFHAHSPTQALLSAVELNRVAVAAWTQFEAGNYSEATEGFRFYFKGGGKDPEMMAVFAFSLAELGLRNEATQWARKAAAASPESKAAKLINDALNSGK